MLHFIGGALVGALAATYAIALVAAAEDNCRDRKIRELRAANTTLQEEYDSAKRLEIYWRARCLRETMDQPSKLDTWVRFPSPASS